MYIYMKVTSDKYELPLVIANSVAELAWMTGVSENTIKSAISHVESGRRKKSAYVRVKIEEETQ